MKSKIHEFLTFKNKAMSKTIRKINELLNRGTYLMLAFFFTIGCNSNTAQTLQTLSHGMDPAPTAAAASSETIRLALLLDTSNSMDGLIDQAKSQLWVIVNELTKARCNGESPNLEIALYEYGNDRLSDKENYIRQVTKFTTDLDTISRELFALSTNGGSEFCGAVIGSSLKQLTWSALTTDLEMIVIAGNEPFTQGPINFKETCAAAKNKNVFINTIFCGEAMEGIKTNWKAGADLSDGAYMNIDQDKKTIYVQTPYDDMIVRLNDSLNDTYVAYGSMGYSKKSSQLEEDKNASVYTKANTVNRTNTKISSKYKNEKWDMVDASKEKTWDVNKVKTEELPKEMQGMTETQKVAYVEKKKADREKIVERIKTVNLQREKYIVDKQLKEDKTKRLDAELIAAIHEQAKKRGFTFEKQS